MTARITSDVAPQTMAPNHNHSIPRGVTHHFIRGGLEPGVALLPTHADRPASTIPVTLKPPRENGTPARFINCQAKNHNPAEVA